MKKHREFPELIIIRQIFEEERRPKKGFVLFERKENQEFPLFSRRNLPLKFKTLEQVAEYLQERSNRKEHIIKLFMDLDSGNVEGTLTVITGKTER